MGVLVQRLGFETHDAVTVLVNIYESTELSPYDLVGTKF